MQRYARKPVMAESSGKQIKFQSVEEASESLGCCKKTMYSRLRDGLRAKGKWKVQFI